MYQDGDNNIREIENLLMDFSYEMGRGWPYNREGCDRVLSQAPYSEEPEPILFEASETIVSEEYLPPAGCCGAEKAQGFPCQAEQAPPASGEYTAEAAEIAAEIEMETEQCRQLQNRVCKQLRPHIQIVLREHQYENSPIYTEELDRETLAQLVDRIMDFAQEEEERIEEITATASGREWDRRHLLRTLIEVLTLEEIYLHLRPKYKDWLRQSWDGSNW